MKKSKSLFFLSLFFIFNLTSCSTMRLRYQTDFKANDQRSGLFTYEKNYQTSGYQLLCIITGIVYGGWCWAYLGLPTEKDQALMSEESLVKLKGLLSTNEVEVFGAQVERVGWDLVEDVHYLAFNDDKNGIPARKPSSVQTDTSPEPKESASDKIRRLKGFYR